MDYFQRKTPERAYHAINQRVTRCNVLPRSVGLIALIKV